LPALSSLAAAGKLPAELRVMAVARQDHNDKTYREYAREHLEKYANDIPIHIRSKLTSSIVYRKADVTQHEEVAAIINDLAGEDGGGVAVYLALPTGLIAPAVQALAASHLPEGSRVVIEKPFGEDLDSAIALNRLLLDLFGNGEMVYRVDHFLGITSVQNIIALRAANRIFETVWNSKQIEQIEIIWDETLGLEGRAGFYDKAGALRDVMQNHLIQIFSRITMDLPAAFDHKSICQSKVEVLQAVREFTDDEAAQRSCRARFTAGKLSDGRTVPSYIDEEGVDEERGTETFAQIKVEIANERWNGTRFVLRTGKALKEARKAVVVRFRPMSAADPVTNELHIGIEDPTDMGLTIAASASHPVRDLVRIELTGNLPDAELPAYSQVLLDILTGGSDLAVHPQEAEEAWRIMMPFLNAWSQGKTKLREYPAGSSGPDC
jgi:glucose-6-phosphate 1-dehydrogenase